MTDIRRILWSSGNVNHTNNKTTMQITQFSMLISA